MLACTIGKYDYIHLWAAGEAVHAVYTVKFIV